MEILSLSLLWTTFRNYGLYPAKSTTSKEFMSALLQWVSIFGVPKEIRSDGGSQFTSKMAEYIRSLLHYDHLVVVAYHPEANGIVERRMKEVMKHLRALVYEKRIREVTLGAIVFR